MEIRLSKPWRPLTAENVRAVGGYLGVFEVADEVGRVQYVGYAGANTLFGLRSALDEQLRLRPPGWQFRYEVNMQYRSRYRELLMAHLAGSGELPPLNRDNAPRNLGRLR